MKKWQEITLIGCSTCLGFALLVVVARYTKPTTKKVHEVSEKLPEFTRINVTAPDRFLNDLKLSPMWKVEKERNGTFLARARSIKPGRRFGETGRMFLFELMTMKDKVLPKDYRIRNKQLDGLNTFSALSAIVLFHKPSRSEVTFGKSGQNVTLGIYEFHFKTHEMGLNSSSYLAVKLSSQHDIYVLLREQGADPTRSTTFAKLPLVLRELADIAASPEKYRNEERYQAFFKLFFELPLREHELKRFPDLNDRDTFYGYFRYDPTTSYEGLNIKISHPVYCPDEGTGTARLRKAEYLGRPYYDKDILFFLIEDNAVYLPVKYNKQFGIFSGTGSFDGNLEILNAEDIVLLKATEKFKGWEQ